MQKTDLLIHTKLRLPFTRPELVNRPRLLEQIDQGLHGPLTLVIAPAGFGKTTLVASCMAACGKPVAWLSLDNNDNQQNRFLSYLIAALQEFNQPIGNQAEQFMAASQQANPEEVLTSLINDLDAVQEEIILVLDDYHFISNQKVHEAVTFLLEHCPRTLHLVITSRSDPPLPLIRLRARGQTVELRAVDLRFNEHEATQFLNEVMGLSLDEGSITMLAERTEGWITGLQMASIALQSHLSLRDHVDAAGFIEGFSGTNRYILDYLLEEVLASQPPEIQHFLLRTSILERLTAPLCDAILTADEVGLGPGADRTTGPGYLFSSQSAPILEYLERANLFLVPLDDERIWYRYHHLFADLLLAQLHKSLGIQKIAQLHIRASDWHGTNGSIVEAIQHASMANDEERVERFIEQNYIEMVRRGEQSWIRFWTGKLSKEAVYRRPWLCIYEAYSHSWFGEPDEAELLLDVAEERIRADDSMPETQEMLGLLAYVKSRVTALRGDIQRAIEYCLEARQHISKDNLALQLDTRITLGYEYFLSGNYDNASPILQETIQMGMTSGAVINTVAASCLLARLFAVQGLLRQSYDVYQKAAHSIPGTSGQHLGARSLVEIGMAETLYEWNELGAALSHMQRGLSMLPFWGKVDDSALAYTTLARIHLALKDKNAAQEATEKAFRLVQASSVFPEARNTVEMAQVRLWLAQDDLQAAGRWAASQEMRLQSDGRCGFDNELAHITLVRVYLAQKKVNEAASLLSHLEESARSAGRMGRVIEIMLLQALVFQERGDLKNAILFLTKCLERAEPEGYVRIYLDEEMPMQRLLALWVHETQHGSAFRKASGLADARVDLLREYANHLLSLFAAAPQAIATTLDRTTAPGLASKGAGPDLVEPLSQRELEVLQLIALGKTNQEIARQLVVAPGTIKAHTSNIFRKLDVSNRTEAVGRARQLGILR